MRIARTIVACLALGGCASSAHTALGAPSVSNSSPAHGSLADHDYALAVAVARAEVNKYPGTTLTSATVTIDDGTVTDPNYGPPCTSGKLLHIKLIGTFPYITHGALGGQQVPDPITAVLITADAVSGAPCQSSALTKNSSPEPGAVLLFTK